MKSYEGVFVFPPEAPADGRKEQFKNLDDLIAKFQGVIQQKTDWGKKPLGYPVRKFQEGHFLIVDFQMGPDKMTEFRKLLELQEDIMKFMLTVKRPAKPNAKAAKAPAAAAAPVKPAGTRPVSHNSPQSHTSHTAVS